MALIKAGDKLVPEPLWNKSSRPRDRLEIPCTVLAVRSGVWGCQSGVMFDVMNLGGDIRTLDAGWFEPPGASE
jgi:hypothetical protein